MDFVSELQAVSEKRRADYCRRRCLTLAIAGVTLHSYRYAWAERAKTQAMPSDSHNSRGPPRLCETGTGQNTKLRRIRKSTVNELWLFASKILDATVYFLS